VRIFPQEGRSLTPLQVLASSFAISSVGGLAALLRSNQPLTVRAVVACILYCGMLGFIIGALWMKEYGLAGDPYFILAVSGLAGIGGVSVVDLVIIAAKRSGIKLVLSRGKDSKHDDEDPADENAA
jgi:hypothetical protein